LRAEQSRRSNPLPRLAFDDPVALMRVEARLDDVGVNPPDLIAE
jgi:hypothetical protein